MGEIQQELTRVVPQSSHIYSVMKFLVIRPVHVINETGLESFVEGYWQWPTGLQLTTITFHTEVSARKSTGTSMARTSLTGISRDSRIGPKIMEKIETPMRADKKRSARKPLQYLRSADSPLSGDIATNQHFFVQKVIDGSLTAGVVSRWTSRLTRPTTKASAFLSRT